ncbi:hypothetical protein [Longimicrobium terrae]|uniref:hypothetical protein n=1 Tax=Longimicrobium terrae TaxID=1639882 RepID=UPI001C8502BC|nr:hypothetical protein [Longimicrobium terrae]
MAALERAAARYGFEPVPNELPFTPEREDADAPLRRHMAHLRLDGTVLDPRYPPRPRLTETEALDGVPLVVTSLDRYPPFLRCIVCAGAKGETYMICAGCYTTQIRVAEHVLLQILPNIDEAALGKVKALEHGQFVRATRGAPRLEPKRRGQLDPGAEAARRAARLTASRAIRAARIEMLRAAAEEPGITPWTARRRAAELRACEAAEPWNAGEWERGLAALSLDDAWLGLLGLEAPAHEREAPDDEYPVEWLDDDWMSAPDRVAFVEDATGPLIARTNTAAGGPEHAAALQRNELFRQYQFALREAEQAEGRPSPNDYLDWLVRSLKECGGIPVRTRARMPGDWDDEECGRWDRWIDGILSGGQAAPPEGLDPLDVLRAAAWARASTTAEDGEVTPVVLPRLDTGLPSGRLRWSRFISEEIEAEFQPWGRWAEIPEEDGSVVRVWTGEAEGVGRRLRPGVVRSVLVRRLKEWTGKAGTPPTRPTGGGIRQRGTRAAWERDIRAERRRRRFERMAIRTLGVDPFRMQGGLTQPV